MYTVYARTRVWFWPTVGVRLTTHLGRARGQLPESIKEGSRMEQLGKVQGACALCVSVCMCVCACVYAYVCMRRCVCVLVFVYGDVYVCVRCTIVHLYEHLLVHA